ncbi:hypothetical protein [Streptomyces spiramyceticus]|uniref:hypothetical protein n=1 Tax=Streptomyces spiramyceticus TaxID=299717 RepID=UPI00237B94C3|nr:hypothetical protein [Streptomyces spiramyceticus]
MVLPPAVTDTGDLDRLNKLFGAMWNIKRAVQRDARAKVDAYWAAKCERDRDGAKAVRQRLGLSREALERSAYKHLENAGHLKHHASKALAMHMADEVWNGVQRHSAPRTAGRRDRATPDETPQGDHAGAPGPRPGCNPQLILW